MHSFDKKMGWATFCALLSKTHLVTLVVMVGIGNSDFFRLRVLGTTSDFVSSLRVGTHT
jgi:hypothetical protein